MGARTFSWDEELEEREDDMEDNEAGAGVDNDENDEEDEEDDIQDEYEKDDVTVMEFYLVVPCNIIRLPQELIDNIYAAHGATIILQDPSEGSNFRLLTIVAPYSQASGEELLHIQAALLQIWGSWIHRNKLRILLGILDANLLDVVGTSGVSRADFKVVCLDDASLPESISVIEVLGSPRTVRSILIDITNRILRSSLRRGILRELPSSEDASTAPSLSSKQVDTRKRARSPEVFNRNEQRNQRPRVGLNYNEYLAQLAARETAGYRRGHEGASQNLPPQLTEDQVEQLLFFCIAEEHKSIGRAPRVSDSELVMQDEFCRFREWSPRVTLDLPQYNFDQLEAKAESPLDRIEVNARDALLQDLRGSRCSTIVPSSYVGDKSTIILKHQADSIYTGDNKGIIIRSM